MIECKESKQRLLYKTRLVCETKIKTRRGYEVLIYTSRWSNLNYGTKEDCLDKYYVDTDNFSHAIDTSNCGSGFNKKGKFGFFKYSDDCDWSHTQKVYESSFIGYKVTPEFKEVDRLKVNFSSLQSELSVQEYIDFMKDNGLDVTYDKV